MFTGESASSVFTLQMEAAYSLPSIRLDGVVTQVAPVMTLGLHHAIMTNIVGASRT